MSSLSYTLLIFFPNGHNATLLFEREEVTFGRSTSADVVLSDAGVSRMHARLVLRGGLLFIDDLESANGTYLNDVRAKNATAVREGDWLRIGNHTIKVQSLNGTRALPYDSPPKTPEGILPPPEPELEEPKPVRTGTMRAQGGLVMPLMGTEVSVAIAGPVANVTMVQRFRNPTEDQLEATYLFPLVHDASVSALRFELDGRTVHGVLKEKAEAERDFARARAQGRAASLLKQTRPDLFSMAVTRIPAGGTITVHIAYQSRLAFDDGEYRFVLPLATTERYSPGAPRALSGTHGASTDAVPDGAALRSRLPAEGEATPSVSVSVSIQAGVEIDAPRCLSHRVRSASFGPSSWRVTLEEAGGEDLKDFVLAYRPKAVDAPVVMFERAWDRPGTFMLSVMPSIPEAEGAGLPRDVLLLIDRSCSMRGGSLEQARRAARYVLDGLGREDRFAVVAFDHDRVAHTGEDASTLHLIGAVDDGLEQARGFIKGLEPRGGTELERALELIERVPVTANRTALVVLMTDAAVGNDAKLLRLAEASTGSGAKRRMYVLGVGPAVNRYLIARLAEAGGGASDVVLPGEDVETTVARFARRVREAGPVLTDMALRWEGALTSDVYPQPIPDLFSGQPVALVGRYNGEGKSRLTIEGTAADGRRVVRHHDVELPAHSEDYPGLSRVWARGRIEDRMAHLQRIGDRMAHLLRTPMELAELRAEVIGLSLKYNVISAYTAFIAEDEEGGAKVSSVEGGAPELVSVEVPSPAPGGTGVSLKTMGVDLPPPGGGPPPRAPMGAPPSPMRPPSPAMVRSIESPPPPAPAPPPPPMGGAPEPIRPIAPAMPSSNEGYTEEEIAYVAGRVAGEIDLVFMVDETGSMGPYITQVKRHVLFLIEAITSSPLCSSLRVGLVSYRDHPPQDTSFVTKVLPLTFDVATIQSGVARMNASGGGDGPESVTEALYDIVRLDWREEAARTVIWIGDAPPHGVGNTGDGFPQGPPTGHHWYTQAESCREMNVVVHAVGCAGLSNYRVGVAVYKLVARTARGLYVPLNQATALVPFVVGAAEAELDKQRIEALVAELLEAEGANLKGLDDGAIIARVTGTLRSQDVRKRSVRYQGDAGVEVGFDGVAGDDVEEAISKLRRKGKTDL